MNLNEIEDQIINVKYTSEMLFDQYKVIVPDLLIISDNIGKVNFSLAKKVLNLVERYNEIISKTSSNYSDSIDRISDYITDTNRNITDLTISISNTIKELDITNN